MKTVIKYLRALANGKQHPAFTQVGICNNVLNTFKEIKYRQLENMCKSWPKFSGDVLYPVPHPHKSPYCAYQDGIHLWSGEYGDNRKDLCKHIANELAYVMYLQEVLAFIQQYPSSLFICPAIYCIKAPKKHATRLQKRVVLALPKDGTFLHTRANETWLQASERFLNNLIMEILP